MVPRPLNHFVSSFCVLPGIASYMSIIRKGFARNSPGLNNGNEPVGRAFSPRPRERTALSPRETPRYDRTFPASSTPCHFLFYRHCRFLSLLWLFFLPFEKTVRAFYFLLLPFWIKLLYIHGSPSRNSEYVKICIRYKEYFTLEETFSNKSFLN